MLKSLFQKNYIFYGGSIVISRGLEYFVLFFAAGYLTKESYGELEFYKKIIEVGSNVLAFGFPALILSYTKSKESKIYFYILSIAFVLLLMAVLSLAGLYQPILFLLIISMAFYGLFFTGGIAQSYQIVHLGSNYASLYKIVISILFYGAVFGLIYFFQVKGEAYLYPSLILLPLVLIYSYFDLRKANINFSKLRKYWQLFKKLLLNSFTLVVSNFANLMFLYTDIFVIKLLSEQANSEIADFSFALNVASVLLLISMTLIQVDIEKLKNKASYFKILNKKIVISTFLLSLSLIVGYYILIHHFYLNFNKTFLLFIVILFGKIFASLSNLYGTYLVILKKFKLNLNINLAFLLLNIVSCWLGYLIYGIIGLAIASAIMLALRFSVLYYFNKKYIHL
jgi:O-antigen/teichoic acid export membrane protein